MGVRQADEGQDEEPEPLYLWPENLESWRLFQQVGTQWISEGGCRTGLNYPGVEMVLRYECPRGRRKDMFRDIREMEVAALLAWEEKRSEND
jgi:hypothetical protein